MQVLLDLLLEICLASKCVFLIKKSVMYNILPVPMLVHVVVQSKEVICIQYLCNYCLAEQLMSHYLFQFRVRLLKQ